MTNVTIPRPIDEMDEALDKWEKAIDELAHAHELYLQSESIFKSWEASTKKVYMDYGKSAAASETEVKSQDYWLEKMQEINTMSIDSEKKKRLCRLAEARWETARSKQVTLRNIK